MLSLEELAEVHVAITEDGGSHAAGANLLLSLTGQAVKVSDNAQGLQILQGFCQSLLDAENYGAAATLQWGRDMFDLRPKFARDVFDLLPPNHKNLLQGCCSGSKTFSAVAWHLLDYLRDAKYTSIKMIAVNESHLKSNMFAHMLALFRALAVPMLDADDVIVREADNYLGLKSAGNDMGIDGVAFRQSKFGSGTIRGFKPKPYRKVDHPKWGHMTRVRILGDECLPFDQEVLMADGSYRKIGELVREKSSETVMSVNNETGALEPKPIIGWHTVPRRGRRIVQIGDARMTEDHPILTPCGYIEACDAATIGSHYLHVSTKILRPDRKTDPATAITDNWKLAWRRINSEGEPHAEREREVHTWGHPTRLSSMEEGDAGSLLPGQHSWSVSNGVRRVDLQRSLALPPRDNRDSLDLVSGRTQDAEANIGSGSPQFRPDGCCSVVHGRREHLHAAERATRGENLNLLIPASGRDAVNRLVLRSWDCGTGVDLEGQDDHLLQSSRHGEVAGDDFAVLSSEPHIQADWLRLPSKARDTRIAHVADDEEVRDLRSGVSCDTIQQDVLQGVQGEAPSLRRVEGGESGAECDAVFCLDVADNHNFFAGSVCVKNCQHWPAGQFKDLNSPMASMTDTGLVKVTLAYNPVDISLTVVQMAEPEQGWQDCDLDKLHRWTSKQGWNVLRLDGAQCENVVNRKVIYPGFITYDYYLGTMAGGDNSATYYVEARGFPPVNNATFTIIPTTWANNCWGEATFVGDVKWLAAADMAYSGGDKAIMAVARWGLASGWRKRDGTYTVFKDRLNPGLDKPRLALQIDQLIPLIKSSDTIAAAEDIMAKCKEMGIKPENFVLDRTGMGAGTHSHLMRYWGQVLGVTWGEKSTSAKILSDDNEGADKTCDNNVTEMWWTLRQWINPTVGAVFINPGIPTSPLMTQLTYRRYFHLTKGRIRVEAKEEFKARQKVGCDEGDATVMLLFLIRQRLNEYPGMRDQLRSHLRELGVVVSHEDADEDAYEPLDLGAVGPSGGRIE